MTPLVLTALVTILQAAPAPAPAGTLIDDVRSLTSADANEGRFDALTALLKVRGLSFTVEPFSLDKPVGREPRTEGRNVVVSIGQGATTIVVGAHYDAARLQDGTLSHGAVDNAASSVILVRLAEALVAAKLPGRVNVVWFDMEELGLVGSAKYVERHAAEPPAMMLNFDVNGYGDTMLFGPAARADNAALRRAYVETCAAEDVPCVGLAQMPPGDDRPFVRAGIPTLSSGLLPSVEAHQLWLLMNGGAGNAVAPAILKTIHTPDDVVDKVREESMIRVQRFALSLLRRLARQ